MTVGFIGLGTMGLPMALNLARAGTRLVVWNRSSRPCEVLQAAGADVAATPAQVFERTDLVVLMLVDAPDRRRPGPVLTGVRANGGQSHPGSHGDDRSRLLAGPRS